MTTTSPAQLIEEKQPLTIKEDGDANQGIKRSIDYLSAENENCDLKVNDNINNVSNNKKQIVEASSNNCLDIGSVTIQTQKETCSQPKLSRDEAKTIVQVVKVPTNKKPPSEYMRFKTMMINDVKVYGTSEMKNGITTYAKDGWKKVSSTRNSNKSSVELQINKENFNIHDISYLGQLKARVVQEELNENKALVLARNQAKSKIIDACLVLLDFEPNHEITTDDHEMFKEIDSKVKNLWLDTDLPTSLAATLGYARDKMQEYEHNVAANDLVRKIQNGTHETLFTFAKSHVKALAQLEVLLKKEGKFVAIEKVRAEEEEKSLVQADNIKKDMIHNLKKQMIYRSSDFYGTMKKISYSRSGVSQAVFAKAFGLNVGLKRCTVDRVHKPLPMYGFFVSSDISVKLVGDTIQANAKYSIAK